MTVLRDCWLWNCEMRDTVERSSRHVRCEGEGEGEGEGRAVHCALVLHCERVRGTRSEERNAKCVFANASVRICEGITAEGRRK
jgi:hypothetical protein